MWWHGCTQRSAFTISGELRGLEAAVMLLLWHLELAKLFLQPVPGGGGGKRRGCYSWKTRELVHKTHSGVFPWKKPPEVLKGLIWGSRSVNPPLESCMMETLGEEIIQWDKGAPSKKKKHPTSFPKSSIPNGNISCFLRVKQIFKKQQNRTLRFIIKVHLQPWCSSQWDGKGLITCYITCQVVAMAITTFQRHWPQPHFAATWLRSAG